jgi:hypothetical protein
MSYLPGDAARDGIGLIEAVHHGDQEGGVAILRNCDRLMVCAFLARLVTDLVEGTCEDPGAALASLRQFHAEGYG